MTAKDQAVVALFDVLAPQLEEIREGMYESRRQARLRDLLAVQRDMVSNNTSTSLNAGASFSLRVAEPLYETADGEIVHAPMPCTVSKGGRSGPLAATQSATVTFAVQNLRGGHDMLRGAIHSIRVPRVHRMPLICFCPGADGLLYAESRSKIFKQLVGFESDVNPSEYTIVKSYSRRQWMPMIEVRTRPEWHPLGASASLVRFEFRLSRLCETVNGPRGLWWDELARLFFTRLAFAPFQFEELEIKLDC